MTVPLAIAIDAGNIFIFGNFVHWTIPDFFNLAQFFSSWVRSTSFYLKGKECELGIWPNEWEYGHPDRLLGLFLINRKNLNPDPNLRVLLGINQGGEIRCFETTWHTDLNCYIQNTSNEIDEIQATFMERTELEWNSDVLDPDGQMKIFCMVYEKIGNLTVKASTQKDSEHVDNVYRSKETEEKSRRQERYVKNLEKLSKNLKDLYYGSKDYDLTIKVHQLEFPVHRAILRARSPVFDAMLTHDMVEKCTGIIPVDDCDPEVFNDFLIFVYTGRLDNLSDSNACGLYYVAEKYDVPELKEECVQFLKKSLSTETICEVVTLAAGHNETELLELAINFFGRNLEEILVSVQWQLFLEKNPLVANELIIKTLKLGYTKKTK